MQTTQRVSISPLSNPVYCVTLTIEGEKAFEAMTEFFSYHQKEWDESPAIALFLMRDFMVMRGYQSKLTTAPDIGLRKWLSSWFMLKLGEVCWKHKGMSWFRE